MNPKVSRKDLIEKIKFLQLRNEVLQKEIDGLKSVIEDMTPYNGEFTDNVSVVVMRNGKFYEAKISWNNETEEVVYDLGTKEICDSIIRAEFEGKRMITEYFNRMRGKL